MGGAFAKIIQKKYQIVSLIAFAVPSPLDVYNSLIL
jgi:hypothetical protein